MDRSNETVSVIVPVYNAQKYLRKCLASILAQSYRDLQIILVDDGSTDQSLKICRAFAEKDRRVQVFTQENRGVSAARNLGLEHVSGKYLSFVDADDWLPRESVSRLVRALNEADAQFSVGSMYCVYPTGSFQEKLRPLTVKAGVEEQAPAKAFFSDMHYYAHVAKKMLLTEIVRENGICFPEGVKCGEDSCFMLDYLLRCDVVTAIPDVVYYNMRLTNSTGGTRYYPQRHVWATLVLQKLDLCLGRFLNAEDRRAALTQEALKTIEKTAKHHIYGEYDKEKAWERVKETCALLSPYVVLRSAENEEKAAPRRYLAELEARKTSGSGEKIVSPYDHAGSPAERIKRSCKKILAACKYLWLFVLFPKSQI